LNSRYNKINLIIKNSILNLINMMNLQHGDSGATFFGSSSSNDDSDFNERNAVTSKVVKMSTGDESNPYKEIANLKSASKILKI
jgi:hypothetical protein